MRDAEEIRAELAALKPQLRQEYPIRDLGVFGSYARGEQQPESDLDVLVTFDEPVSLFAFIRLEERLADELGIAVDLVTGDSLKPRIGERVAEDVVYV